MKFNKDALLGTVFFAGLGLLLLATAQLKDWTVLSKPVIKRVFFPSAEGLRAGDPVTVYGIRAGRVQAVSINPSQDQRERRVMVELELKQEVPFQEGIPYLIAIEDSSFLGGKVVSIDPETTRKGRPWRHDEPLLGTNLGNPLSQVAEVFAESGGDLKGILGGLASVVGKADSDRSTIGALFAERTLYDSVLDSARRLNEVIRGVQEGRGTVGGLLQEREPFEDLKATLAQVRKTTEGLNARESLLSRAIHDKQMGDDGAGILADLRALTETARRGEGTLGKLILKDDIHRELEGVLQEARGLVAQARTGEGLIARLLSDKSLADQVAGVAARADAIMASIAAGEGTLGKLIRDDSVYVQFNLVLRQISRALEDAREAAPISTFITVLSSSFR